MEAREVIRVALLGEDAQHCVRLSYIEGMGIELVIKSRDHLAHSHEN